MMTWEEVVAKIKASYPDGITYAQARAFASLPFVPSLDALRPYVKAGEWPTDGRHGTTPLPTTPAPPAPPAERDPVLQTLLQMAEYAKPGTSTTPVSGVGKVTALPGGGGGGGGNSTVLIVVVVGVVAGGFFLLKKKKKPSGGTTHVES